MAAPEVVPICFLFLAFLTGSFVTYMLSRTIPAMPYTVVCFLFGIGYGALGNRINLFVLGESINQWEHINPDLILFVFLPSLLFGESMSLNIHHLRRTGLSSIILAVPGSLLATYLLAVCVQCLVPYEWSWLLCLTFSAILCATDPVAIVSVLKKVGASQRFTMLLTLESLLNDSMALVLFHLFVNSLLTSPNDRFYSTADIVFYFFTQLVVSSLLGAAIGVGGLFGISLGTQPSKAEDNTIQLATTICTAYISFFVGEYVLHLNGVLCCCASGLIIGWYGPPLILHPETIHSVWSTFEWMGNTMVFILAGLLVGSINYRITGIDVAVVVLVYVLGVLTRAAKVHIFIHTSTALVAHIRIYMSLYPGFHCTVITGYRYCTCVHKLPCT